MRRPARRASSARAPVERASAGIGQRHGWAAPWVLPALLGLVIAVLGTGAAIAISSDGEEPNAISTATGGSLTVTNDGSTLTAPEPTEPTTTTAAVDHDRTEAHDHPEAAGQPGGDRLAPRPARLDDRARLAPAVERSRRRRTRRRPRRAAPASAASASSTPGATRAFIPATTSSSPASSTPRRRHRVRSSGPGPSSLPRTSARSSRSLRGVGIRGGGQTRSERIDARPDPLAPLKTIVNDFVTAPVVRILEVDHPRRNLIFGLCMGQNRER